MVLDARVSRKKPVEAGNLVRQLECLREYATQRGYAIAAAHRDVASGLNPNRRGLVQVLRTAEQGRCDRWIIEHPDRLA